MSRREREGQVHARVMQVPVPLVCTDLGAVRVGEWKEKCGIGQELVGVNKE